MSAENSRKQRKARGKPFAKGTSGNPGGRPKGYTAFRESFAAEDDVAKIQARLREIIRDGEAKDVVNAARLWLEYGFGKAPSAPEDLKAVEKAGGGWPLTREETLRIARGEKP